MFRPKTKQAPGAYLIVCEFLGRQAVIEPAASLTPTSSNPNSTPCRQAAPAWQSQGLLGRRTICIGPHRAACRGLDLDRFFEPDLAVATAAWCRDNCDVVAECAAHHLIIERPPRYGVVGGMTPAERDAAAADRRMVGRLWADRYRHLSSREASKAIAAAGGPKVSYRTIARIRDAEVHR